MGAILSNASSVTHASVKSHMTRVDCNAGPQLLFTDASNQTCFEGVRGETPKKGRTYAHSNELFSVNAVQNGSSQNSFSGFQDTSTVTDSHASGSSGVKKISFPSLLKKSKHTKAFSALRRETDQRDITADLRAVEVRGMPNCGPVNSVDHTETQQHVTHKTPEEICPIETVGQMNRLPEARINHGCSWKEPGCEKGAYTPRQGTPYGPYPFVREGTAPCETCRHFRLSVDHATRFDSPKQLAQKLQPSINRSQLSIHYQQTSSHNQLQKRHSHCSIQTNNRARSSYLDDKYEALQPLSSFHPPPYWDVSAVTEPVPDLQIAHAPSHRRLSLHSTAAVRKRSRFVVEQTVGEERTNPGDSSDNYRRVPSLSQIRFKTGSPADSSGSRLKFQPYSFTELTLALSPNPHIRSPHPTAANRIQMSTHPSPANAPPEDMLPGTGKQFRLHRRSTESYRNSKIIPNVDMLTSSSNVNTNSSSAYNTRTKDSNSRCKSLKKSISCYALKFFSHHYSHTNVYRTRTGGNLGPYPFQESLGGKQRQISANGNRSVALPADIVNPTGTWKRDHNEQMADKPEGTDAVWQEKVVFAKSKKRLVPVIPHYRSYRSVACTEECSNYSDLDYLESAIPPSFRDSGRRVIDKGNCTLMYSSVLDYPIKPGTELSQQRIALNGRYGEMHLWNTDSRQTVFKATTSELLRCLSFFVSSQLQLVSFNSPYRTRMCRMRNIQPPVIVSWIRSVDRALLMQGWSDLAFINPSHIVFLYMMLKGFIDNSITSERELHSIVMACLYLSYSYMGNEISYPLKPFLVAETNQLVIQNDHYSRRSLHGQAALLNGHETSIRGKVIDQVRNRFWQYCLRIINAKASEMLRINADPACFTELLVELRSYDSLSSPFRLPVRVMTVSK